MKQLVGKFLIRIRGALGSPLLPHSLLPSHSVALAEESYHGISNLNFVITLVRPALVLNSDGVAASYEGLLAYLLTRDHHSLKTEFQHGTGRTEVGCIEDLPPVTGVGGTCVLDRW
ncbi:isoleucine--tRNA ligase [Salvia divinorum]|uniref:Isoleucine--tRNA ligase n=1 Tax=Salvia divinorum TaxID=28513 RepID=A0ABD1G384_SALDI